MPWVLDDWASAVYLNYGKYCKIESFAKGLCKRIKRIQRKRTNLRINSIHRFLHITWPRFEPQSLNLDAKVDSWHWSGIPLKVGWGGPRCNAFVLGYRDQCSWRNCANKLTSWSLMASLLPFLDVILICAITDESTIMRIYGCTAAAVNIALHVAALWTQQNPPRT